MSLCPFPSSSTTLIVSVLHNCTQWPHWACAETHRPPTSSSTLQVPSSHTHLHPTWTSTHGSLFVCICEGSVLTYAPPYTISLSVKYAPLSNNGRGAWANVSLFVVVDAKDSSVPQHLLHRSQSTSCCGDLPAQTALAGNTSHCFKDLEGFEVSSQSGGGRDFKHVVLWVTRRSVNGKH